MERQLREALVIAAANSRMSAPADLACVLDGKALQIMLRPDHKAALLKLVMQCKASRKSQGPGSQDSTCLPPRFLAWSLMAWRI